MERTNTQVIEFLAKWRRRVTIPSNLVTNTDALLDWITRTSGEIKTLQKEIDTLRKWTQRETDKIGDLASKKGFKPSQLEFDQHVFRQRSKVFQKLKSTSRYDHKPFNIDAIQSNETYIYVVPHSHTDLGWLETVEDYYSKCSRMLIKQRSDQSLHLSHGTC
jgi:Glycosyl hydrolases family 38 N-terminal domain